MTDRSETIAAYLDGSLDGAALTAFEAEIAKDDALAKEVARFAANDDLLRAAFDAPMQEPVNSALLERMGLGDVAAGETHGTNTTSTIKATAANDNPAFWRRWQWLVGGAIAASLALFAVFQPGRLPQSERELAAALETAPSATLVQLASGGSVTPRLTFTAGDGRVCREYLQAGQTGNQIAIACRSDGRWQIEAAIKGGAALPSSGEIVAASGEDGAGLDAAYARLGASDPLDSKAEQMLIEEKWVKP